MPLLPDLARTDWRERNQRANAAYYEEYMYAIRFYRTAQNGPDYLTMGRVPIPPAARFIPSWDMREEDKRLMLLAAHLEHADERHEERGEPTYWQGRAVHKCGTPACALGHSYAFYLAGRERWTLPKRSAARMAYNACLFYGLNNTEWEELFGYVGCGNAQTAKQAAAYIRGFVMRRHRPAQCNLWS